MSFETTKPVARMSASETMWDGESPRFNAEDFHQFDLPRQELMLKRKAVFLEEFLRNGGMEPRSVEDRCEILQQRIDSLEDELTTAGKLDAACRYIEHAPRSDLDAINRDDFMPWFRRSRGPESSISQVGRIPGIVRKKTLEPSTGDFLRAEGSLNTRSVSHRSKRVRASENEKPPCLRCRILKKRCDIREQCSHCPEQSYDNSGDFWKVLGCFREPLRGLSAVFCPRFSRSTRRTLKHRNGSTEIINLLLTKSRVSVQKRKRILQLVHADIRFSQLIDSSWEDIAQRQSVSLAATSFEEFADEDSLLGGKRIHPEDYEAPWSVLQAISMDQKYLTPTEYNLFELIRQGNEFSKYEPSAWDLFKQAKRLLRQAVEIYLLERLCAHMASGDMIGPPPFHPASASSSNTLILIDIKDDMEKFLCEFEMNCSGRAKLIGHAQLACLYALLVFGIAKSMLIDAYSIREDYEEENPWKFTDATAITSAYKALVSCFCWSSKTDVMLQTERSDDSNGIYNAIQDTRNMVRQNQWEERGYKGTKDFLLNLGSSLSSEGNFNGFLAQKFGLGGLVEPPSRTDVQPTVSLGDNSCIQSIEFLHGREQLVSTTWPLVPFDRGPIAAAGPSVSSFTFIENDGPGNNDKPGRRHGGRKGALDPDTLRKAREVRKIGSCWNCWSIRMACLEGTPCDRCQRVEGFTTQTCFRMPFMAYASTFFPEVLNSQFSTRALEEYMHANTAYFADEAMEVEVTWGAGVTINLQATPFIQAPNGEVQTAYHSRDGQPLGVESLPLGILASEISTLEQTCLSRLESGLVDPDFSALFFDRRTSNLSKLVLQVVLSYYNTMQNKHPILQDLLILYMAILTTSRPILFTKPSVTNIFSKLHSELPLTGLYSSRLLNLQLKYGFYNLARQLTDKALGKLEKVFRNRDKSLWPVSFSAMLILCLCIEQVQVLTDSFVKASKSADIRVLANMEVEPLKCCQALDNGPFSQLTHIFHLRYRTNKSDESGLNPFTADFFRTNDIEFEGAAVDMISTVQEKMINNDEILQERNMPLDFAGGAENFAKRNSGRLVSAFLLSFIGLRAS